MTLQKPNYSPLPCSLEKKNRKKVASSKKKHKRTEQAKKWIKQTPIKGFLFERFLEGPLFYNESKWFGENVIGFGEKMEVIRSWTKLIYFSNFRFLRFPRGGATLSGEFYPVFLVLSEFFIKQIRMIPTLSLFKDA